MRPFKKTTRLDSEGIVARIWWWRRVERDLGWGGKVRKSVVRIQNLRCDSDGGGSQSHRLGSKTSSNDQRRYGTTAMRKQRKERTVQSGVG